MLLQHDFKGQSGAALRSKEKKDRRHITIREVAKAAGASVATISAALNNSDYVSAEMRGRIQDAIKQLKYRPNDLARGLRLQKTHSIAIIVPDLSNNFYVDVVRGAKDYSASANYTILIGDSRESWEEERNYLDSFHRRRVDGVVRVPAMDAVAKKATPILGNIPVVYADRYPAVRDSSVGRVGVDNALAADNATRYLLSLGHRMIGIISGDTSSGTSADRLKGFLHALSSVKIRPDRSMIHTGNNDMESGHQHAMQLLTRARRPTAIFCTNNMMALGALAAIQEIGLACPEEISLLGFDDFYWSTLLRPRLTVVRQPAREVGMIAARMLIDHVEGRPSVASPVLLATQLVVRDSCSPPKQNNS
ncbi:MAG: LacI family transcriptional regulator [Acidobacteria bacterium]|nr:MAG: LacI family transcriptional regulator [Acidobacteriota bacterium]PYY21494.1 MAG: LacI family transcriptional regulator [Acidobacteriota bacterium]